MSVLRSPQRERISVVIATLGGDTLIHTISALNLGSIVPEEILVCIPQSESSRVKSLSIPNVKILVTECRGQVAQRAMGFQAASYEIVMQIDDDIIVDQDCLKNLLEALDREGRNVAVAPSFRSLATGESVYKRADRNHRLQAIYYWLMNGAAGYEPGKIDRSGSAVGVDPAAFENNLIEVEFLAGGCVMHRRENLVLENFWPLQGKAYYEDLVHSHLLRSKGIKLLVCKCAKCELELFFYKSFGWIAFFRNLAADFHARRYFMRRCSRESPRIYLYYLATILSYTLKRAASLIR